ncbi:CheY-like chemotaxis protein [Microvirga lupini]|uniref:CheY-like chemotaxis protein n=1 Tax=Microvirga lupini TaxID=420324 RepID=A0A7W4VKE9_9HYPH|nr:response regulator [Microvirga lupini]MBB3018820.1 CheY-like chemotaxis protein [Microvirga lupini]
MVSASRSKVSVLVVEDDALTRELLTQLLCAGGFDVIAVPAGDRALLILCHLGEEIDWLVSKVSLPGLVCGWILADEYHEHHPNRPVLLLSDLDPAEKPSANAVFIPPLAPMRVLEVLQALKSPEPAQVLAFPITKAA